MPKSEPPSLPVDAIYTSHYCEENVYLLVQTFVKSELWTPFAVFISNHSKSVALWNQKIAGTAITPVVWDYHVVLALRPKTESDSHTWIYDFDTLLACPSPAVHYLKETFDRQEQLMEQYQSLFRVVPGDLFLDYFASDRSHMIVSGVASPRYPPLCSPKAVVADIGTILMQKYVSMDKGSDGQYGTVLSYEEFMDWCKE